MKNYSAQIDKKNQRAAELRAWLNILVFGLFLAAVGFACYAGTVVFSPGP